MTAIFLGYGLKAVIAIRQGRATAAVYGYEPHQLGCCIHALCGAPGPA